MGFLGAGATAPPNVVASGWGLQKVTEPDKKLELQLHPPLLGGEADTEFMIHRDCVTR